MAPKRTSSRNSGRKDDQQQSPDDNNNNDADMFLSKLAEALSARGSYDWKADEVKLALSTALESLPNAAPKKHIQSKLGHYADSLYEKLSKGASRKKPKRAEKEAPAPKTAKTTTKPTTNAIASIFDSSSSLPAPDTFLDDTYFEAIKSFQDKSEEDQLALLLSRAPVPLSFLRAYALHTFGKPNNSSADGKKDNSSVKKKSSSVEELLEQASKATQLVGSLCSFVRDPAAAAASFDVPLSYLSQAVDAATDDENEWMQLANSILQTIGAVQIAITGATLSAAHISSRTDPSTEYDWIGFTSQLQRNEDNTDAAGNNNGSLYVARRTCGQLVYLHALATIHSAAAAREEENATITASVSAQAVLNLKSLSPYGIYGLLEHQLTQSSTTITTTTTTATTSSHDNDQLRVRCLVCLYNAVHQCSTTSSKGALQYFTIREPNGIALYFLRLKAARVIAKLLADSNPVESASILTRAAATATATATGGVSLRLSSARGQEYDATVLSLMDIGNWLESCPPSSVVVAAIKAWKSGNWEGLSAHLIHVASERDVDMLFTAAASSSAIGGGVHGNTTILGEQKDGMEGVDGKMADDMLFYVSTEGDAFNGGWAAARKGGDGNGNGDDEDEEGGGEGVLSLLEEMEGEDVGEVHE